MPPRSARLSARFERMHFFSFGGKARWGMPASVLLTSALIIALLLKGPGQPDAVPSCSSLTPWIFYGGNWTSNGAVLEATRNGRGDMAISRRHDYAKFTLAVEMQLRDLYPGTNYGDAGVLFRVRNPRLGVDSYNGYYVGLRASDHALVFGRVDEEWQQLMFRQLPGTVTAGAWYRLKIAATGCRFTMSAVPETGGTPTEITYDSPHCLAAGSLGLRVYYTKAAWRDLQVTAER